MRRVWIPAIVLALVATISFALNRKPEAVQTQWLFSFQRQSGGLLSLLCLPNLEAPRITGMAIYTDWGILKPDRYELVGSQNEQEPRVSEQTSDGEKVVTVEGRLKDRQGQSCGLKYRVAHRFAPDEATVEIVLIAERDFRSMHGFFATMLNFVGAPEWFARTRKGWLFAETKYEGRVFQSAHNPLDTSEPKLGICNPKTGWALALTLKDTKPDDLDNVFIHANPTGSGGIFFAWCDGITTREMKAGDEWKISVKLRFVRLDELIGATE